MVYCGKCGAKVEGAYCPKCGAPKPLNIPPVSASFSPSKFCPKCGKAVASAYCTGCGAPRALQLSAARTASSGGSSNHSIPPRPSFKDSADDQSQTTEHIESSMKIPVQLCLKAAALFFSLGLIFSWIGAFPYGNASGTIFSLLMLICALIPAAAAEFAADIYSRYKTMLIAASFGAGTLFSILAFVFTPFYLPFRAGTLVLWLIGFLCMAFVGLRDIIPVAVPNQLDGILKKSERRMFYIMPVILAFGIAFGSFSFRAFVHMVTLAAILFTAEVFDKNIRVKHSVALWTLAVTSIFAFLADFKSGLSILCGLAGLAAVVYLIISFKSVMFPASGTSGSPRPAQPRPSAPPREFTGEQGDMPSYFHGTIGSLIGIKLISFFMPAIVAGLGFWIIGLTAAGGDVNIPLLIILLLVTFFGIVCAGAYGGYLLIRWEVINSEVGGARLGFTGTFGSYIGLCVKIFLLTAITFNWYAILGGADTARIRWKIEHIEGADLTPSYFYGRWYQLFGINLGFGALRIVLTALIWTIAGGAVISSFGGLSLNSIENIVGDPFGMIGNVISTALVSLILAIIFTIIVSFLIGMLQMFYLIKFEVNNSTVDSRQWLFAGTLGGLIGTVLINMLLSTVTCGIYSLLGFDYLLNTKYKITNIRS